jgi:hypothetical protein
VVEAALQAVDRRGVELAPLRREPLRQAGKVIDQLIDGADVDPAAPNFSYDAAGRLRAARVPGRALAYDYAGTPGCGLAPQAAKNTNRSAVVDNGVTTSYCYDAADKLVSTTDTRYGGIAYDARGNTTSLGPQALAYDGADRHVSTTTGSTMIRYVRDATDRIVRREVSGSSTGVVRYGYSGGGDTPDFTLDAANNNVIERTIGVLGGVLLTKRGAGDTWSYPNIHGDVMATADAAGAKQGSTISYDPYGQALGALPDNSAGKLDYAWLGRHQRGTEHEAGMATVEMGAQAVCAGAGAVPRGGPRGGGIGQRLRLRRGRSDQPVRSRRHGTARRPGPLPTGGAERSGR